jgi:hypothetical protein
VLSFRPLDTIPLGIIEKVRDGPPEEVAEPLDLLDHEIGVPVFQAVKPALPNPSLLGQLLRSPVHLNSEMEDSLPQLLCPRCPYLAHEKTSASSLRLPKMEYKIKNEMDTKFPLTRFLILDTLQL